MARFSDLPFELQTVIFLLVLPVRGGVHWVELEGFPQPLDVITQTLYKAHTQFNDLEPGLNDVDDDSLEYEQYCGLKYENGDDGTPLFEYIYPIVPSVWGQSKGPARGDSEDTFVPEIVEEILETRHCRELSTYTQVTTLLSTCHSSRLTALEYIQKMIPNITASLYRGVGPLSRPRSLSTWQRQYEDPNNSPKRIAAGDVLIPTICTTLDLVVLRLHTSSGYATPTLRHAQWQLRPEYTMVMSQRSPTIPVFPRIGIEYRPLWATQEGRKEISRRTVSDVVRLSGMSSQLSAQLYWLIDGIPRPQWDQYHPAIPAAFNRVIERAQRRIFENCEITKDEKRMAQLLEHHNLYQEFEANGRRYYVVFVVANWRSECYLEESYLDPEVDWDGIFPGGEALWPVPLRDLVQLAFDLRGEISDMFCTTLLSWEPI